MAGITFFQTTNEEGETVLKPRPQCETIETLKQMIADGRPQKAIDLFVGYVANGMNWAKYDEWKSKQDAYETKYAEVTDYNANPDLDENDQPILKDYPTEPEPLSFVETTEDAVRAMVSSELLVKQRSKRNAEIENIKVGIDDFFVDGDEQSQTRMTRALLLMKELNVSTHPWKCADNEWRELTQAQFAQAIYDAGLAQTQIMQNYP